MTYEVRFRIRNAKGKVLGTTKPDDDLEPVDVADELLEEMMMGGPTRIDEPLPTQSDHNVKVYFI